HFLRVDVTRAAPFAIGLRQDLGRLDLAAAAPEHVRIAYRDAGLGKVPVDGGLVGEHGFLLGAVGNAHDVHVRELGATFAPVRVSHDVVATHFPAGIDFAPGRHSPVEERVVPGDALTGGELLHVLEKRRETADDAAV